tara:strand:+ start:513 stop:836 length:324 start_codon:yes stop_codon:yes gene_type:complete
MEVVNYNPEDDFYNQVQSIWNKAKGSKTAQKVSKTAEDIKKTYKREINERPLWKVFGIFSLLLFYFYGKNFYNYGLIGVFKFLMSMTIFPFMQSWAEERASRKKGRK